MWPTGALRRAPRRCWPTGSGSEPRARRPVRAACSWRKRTPVAMATRRTKCWLLGVAGRVCLPWPAFVNMAVVAGAVAAAAILAQWRQLDFDVYLMGASHLRSGLYAADLPRTGLPFTYPPFAAVLFVPLSHLPLRWAELVWNLVNIGGVCLLWFVSLLALRPRVPRMNLARWSVLLGLPTAYLLEPLRSAIWAGQVEVLLAAAIVYDLSRVGEARKRRLPPGVLLGLTAAIKLTPLVFIPYLVGIRRTRTAMHALGTFVACCAIGACAAPRASWDYWTRIVFEWGRPGSPAFVSNQSLRGALVRLLHGPVPDVVFIVVVAVAGIGGLALSVRAHRTSSELLGVLVCAATGLAVSPISWTYHYVWIVPVLCWLVLGADRPRHSRLVTLGVAALFILGAPWFVPWRHTTELAENAWQLVVGDSYILALVILMAGLAISLTAEPPRTSFVDPKLVAAVHVTSEPARPADERGRSQRLQHRALSRIRGLS
jgi:alpha-1,2-mannosyltransferase